MFAPSVRPGKGMKTPMFGIPAAMYATLGLLGILHAHAFTITGDV